MAAIKIKKSVGKLGENLPADVKAIQKALNKLSKAAGWSKVPETGEVDAKTQKIIDAFLKARFVSGGRDTIKPGSKALTTLAMDPKEFALIFNDVEFYTIKIGGKTYVGDEQQLKNLCKAISNKFIEVSKILVKSHKNYETAYKEATSGFFQKVAIGSMGTGIQKRAKEDIAAAGKAVDEFKRLANGADPKKLALTAKAMRKTKLRLDQAATSMDALFKILYGGATYCEKASVAIRDNAFDALTIVVVVATGRPGAAGAGMGLAKQATIEGLNKLIIPGIYAQQGGWKGSAVRMSWSTLKGGFWGFLGGKIGKLFVSKAAKTLGPKLANSKIWGRVLTNNRGLIMTLIGRGEKMSEKVIEARFDAAIAHIYRTFHKKILAKYGTDLVFWMIGQKEREIGEIFNTSKSMDDAVSKTSALIMRDGSADQMILKLVKDFEKDISASLKKELQSA